MSLTADPALSDAASVQAALAWATRQIALRGDSPRLDAEILLGHAIGCSRAQLLARPEMTPDPAAMQRFRHLVARRAQGEPIAYLTGEREFWSRRFRVTPATLIPRPETELLIELALERLPPAAPRHVADLGTGSGAIALTLVLERPATRVVATDISPAALEIARENATRLGAAEVEFRLGDWCAALAGERFDLIVSNPPYVEAGDPHLQQGDLPHEPRLALTPGISGLEAIEHIVAAAPAHLAHGGWLLLEHGYDQADAVADLLRRRGYDRIEHRADIGGHRRATAVSHRGEPAQ
ncbi:MAG: peptide chain release factor N(5)-glutamine methyltransferase [Gammaproteobacteria bacterium]